MPPRSSSCFDRSREEVVGLVPVALRSGEPERAHELGQEIELLEELVVELATALVAVEQLVPVRRHVSVSQPTSDRARLFGLPQAHEEVREADERIARLPLGTAHRLRQRVVGAMRERVAVDDEQRSAHRSSPSRSISAISRSVASRAASDWSRPSSRPAGSASRSARAAGRAARAGRFPAIAAGHERHARLERDPRRAGMRLRAGTSSRALSAGACRAGTSSRRVPRGEVDSGLHRLDVPLATPHGEAAAGGDQRASGHQYSSDFAMNRRKRLRPERDPERPGIEVRDVVRREDVAPLVGRFSLPSARNRYSHRAPARTGRRRRSRRDWASRGQVSPSRRPFRGALWCFGCQRPLS